MLNRLFRFNGGVKPAYHKEASTTLPIAVPPAPSLLVIPLHQSIGGTPRPLVQAGDHVLKGQRVGEAQLRHGSRVQIGGPTGAFIVIVFNIVQQYGHEGLAAVEAEPFGLVITDLKMPGMGGLELLSAIRERDTETIVIVMTGFATVETAIEALKNGAYDYILKPFKVSELLQIVERAFEKIRLAAENLQLREQISLLKLSEAVASSLSLDEVLSILVEAAQKEVGADGVELDVWRCASGEVVVIHDEDTGRTCGERVVVPDAPLARLRALDAGAWKGPRFAGERIPLLAEVLEALPGAVVNVELKARRGGRGGDAALARAVAGVIAAARAEARVVVSSFDFGLVAAFRAAAPAVATGLLFEASWHRWLRASCFPR